MTRLPDFAAVVAAYATYGTETLATLAAVSAVWMAPGLAGHARPGGAVAPGAPRPPGAAAATTTAIV